MPKKRRTSSIKMTRQRSAVLSVLRSTTEHPPADWVYSEVRRILPKISLGTVYRNLSELKEAGLVLELDFGTGCSRFDFRTDTHYHVICLKCGRVEDVMIPVKKDLENAASNATGYRIVSHTIQFKGICAACASGS
jgi:Fur family peroxide stress response transcriptional regulator